MQLHLHCVRSKKHKNNLKLNDPIIHLKQEEAEMKEFLLPYGKEKLTAKIEDEHLAGVLLSELHSYKAPKSGAELVQDALEHPIGTPRLCDMAVGKKKVVVISSDHTRPVPSHIMMPLILAEIRKGNPDADITILISTGLHRTTTKEELAAKFGPEIMANEKILQVVDLCKSFHKLDVLKHISVDFEKNEVVSIIGPSGGGKSTFLRCLNLLETPTSGQILFDGVDICAKGQSKHIDQHRQKMGMVFQQFNLFNNMNVMHNLTAAPTRIKGMDKEQAEAKALQLLGRVGLADRADAYPSQLSGGQKQRIAIVRSLMMDPEVMLFDEPTSALDPEMIGEVLDVMKALAADGMTMIVVTHEMRFAREVAARTIFLADGKIEEDKPSHELFDNPESPRLVTFLQKVL